MNGRGWVLRTGEYLVGQASGYLPPSIREERHQEWAAELPVILSDPGVRPPARRAARMLWFAADTLRGAAVARYSAAGRHARRDADGQARDQVTRQGLPALLALPVLLVLWIYLLYPGHSGTGLTYDVVYLLIPLISLLVSLAAREQLSWRRHWYAWSLLAWGTGQLLHDLARHLGWGPPVLFAVIYYGSAAVLIATTGITAAGWVKAARARYREART